MSSVRTSWLYQHLHRWGEWYWVPVLYLTAVVLLYHEIWIGTAGFGWDTIESYWGDLAFLSHQCRNGSLSLWNPYDRGGFPVYADPQPGSYYPVHWLFAGAGCLMSELPWWLIQSKMALHHAIAAMMMHAYLRSRGLPRAAAVVGAMVWLGSAPMLIHKASNVLLPLVWAPLIWIAIDRMVANGGNGQIAPPGGPQPGRWRRSWRRGVALGAAVALAGSAGSPPGFFYTLLLTMPYGLFRVCQAVYQTRRQARQLGCALAIATTAALCLLLITAKPGLDLAAHTLRAERGLSYALSLPMPVWDTFVGLLQPLVGHRSLYIGIVALVLAGCGLCLAPRRDRAAPLCFAAIAVCGLLCAFGSATPVLPWLVEHVPGFGLFRVANRYKLMAVPALAVLAGFGAANLLAAARAWSYARMGALLLTLAALVGLMAVLASREPASDPHHLVRASLISAAVAAVLIGAALWLPRQLARWCLWAMAVVALWEPDHFIHANGPILERPPDPARARALVALENQREKLGDIRTQVRVYDEFVMEQRPGSRLAVRDFRGYPAGDPLDFARYRDVLGYAGKHPEILAAYNVAVVLHAPHHRAGKRAHYVKHPPSRTAPAHFRHLGQNRYQSLRPAPIVAWYGSIRTAATSAEVLDLVRSADDAQSGARRYAVVEADDLVGLRDAEARARLQALDGAPSRTLAGEVLGYETDRVAVRVRAPAPGLVVLNEVHYDGWQVTVDGQAAEPLRADYLLRAVWVEEGVHDIVWTFAPRDWPWLWALWLVGWLILLAAMLDWAMGVRRR